MAKFLWLIVRHFFFPTVADNIVTWDRAVLTAAMIAGFEVYFAWLLQVVMHERAFRVTTTYLFSCMIFSLFVSISVPIWHIDQLNTLLGTVDVDIIRDEANELAPRRGTHPRMPPLGENLAYMVAHSRMAMQDSSKTNDTTLVEAIPVRSTAPSSSCSASFLVLVPLIRVQKLEAQIDTPVHHIHIGCIGLLLR